MFLNSPRSRDYRLLTLYIYPLSSPRSSLRFSLPPRFRLPPPFSSSSSPPVSIQTSCTQQIEEWVQCGRGLCFLCSKIMGWKQKVQALLKGFWAPTRIPCLALLINFLCIYFLLPLKFPVLSGSLFVWYNQFSYALCTRNCVSYLVSWRNAILIINPLLTDL